MSLQQPIVLWGQLSTSAAKGKLSTDLRTWASTLSSGSCAYTDSRSAALSQYLPQDPDTIWCRCLDVYETDIRQPDVLVAVPALLPAGLPPSVGFGEQERVLTIQWPHSSVLDVRLLWGFRWERLLKSTLEMTGQKGNGVLTVICFFI